MRIGNFSISCVHYGQRLTIRPRGMGDNTSVKGLGWPLVIVDNKLYVWGDINQEDPTHVIDLSGALEVNRED